MEDDDAWGGTSAWAPSTAQLDSAADAWGTSTNSPLAAIEDDVWAPAPSSPDLQPSPLVAQEVDEGGFETFEAAEDDFGEFGEEDGDGFGDFEESFAPAASTSTRPISIQQDLQPQIAHLLNLIFPLHLSDLSTEPERQLEGPAQVLASRSALQLFEHFNTPQLLPTTTWKRSKIRKLHLHALDLPIDYDEPPPLPKPSAPTKVPSISVRTDVAPVASPSSAPAHINGNTSRAPRSRTASPSPPPVLDRRKAKDLLALTSAALANEPIEGLEAIQAELVDAVNKASEILTYAVEKREKLKADGETYDQMIQDLVTTAQKLKQPSASSSSSLKRSGSTSKSSNRIFGARAASPLPASQLNASRSSLH